MFNFKNTSKFILVICIISGTFYCATVLAYENPTANAGPDRNISYDQDSINISTTLRGSGYDPNGSNLTYRWTCNGGSLSNPNIAEPVFTVPVSSFYQGNLSGSNSWANIPSFQRSWSQLIIYAPTNFTGILNGSYNSSYRCTLTVTNEFSLSDSDDVTINVNYDGTGAYSVQTNMATNNYNGQATLNGTIFSGTSQGGRYVWFEWGTSSSYGYTTERRLAIGNGVFNQNINGLKAGTTYHFRAVSEDSSGKKYYGQDVTFQSNAAGPNTILTGTTNGYPTNNSPTAVSTGITNDLLKDSFFLPLLLIITGIWAFVYRRNKVKTQRKLENKS